MPKLLLTALLAFTLALPSLRAADDARLAQITTADDERVAAVLSADQARLSAAFSDELHYAHASGNVDTKASYIEALTSGKTKYTGWKYEERHFTFPAPGVALVTGRALVTVAGASGPNEMNLSFLGVYRDENGHWRFVAWQSCKLPPTPAK